MKKAIAILLTATMLLSVLTGCSQGQEGGKEPDAAEPQVSYEDSYKSTFSTSITTLNPYDIYASSDYKFSANFMDGLVETDKYGRLVPCLAESWEHSEDYTEWTFHMRKGIYWVDHQGNKTEHEVDAYDFVTGLKYVADPNSPVSGFSTIRNIIKGLYDYYYLLVDIDEGTVTDVTRETVVSEFEQRVGIQAVDAYTLKFTTENPCSYFDSMCDLNLILPVQAEFLEQVGDEYGTALDKLLYCGGYYISQWDRDKKVVMTANPHYWDPESLNIKTLNWEFVADNISSLELFKRGDVTGVGMTSEDVASVRGTEWEDKVYLSDKTPTTYWFSFNFVSANPEMNAAAQNENFRKAVFTAIDAVTISAIYEPNNPEFFTRYTLLPEGAMIDSNGKDYTDYGGLKAYKESDPFDPEQARAYMEAAAKELCEADGVTLKGVIPGTVDMLPIAEFQVDGKLPIQIMYTGGSSDSEMKIAALVEQMLETYLGTDYIDVLTGHSSNSFSSEVYDLGNWDLLQDSYSFRFADPSANLDRCTSDYDITESGYSIPEFDAMVEKASGIYKVEDRYTAYADAEAWLLEHAYIKPFMTGGGSYNMTRIVPYTAPGGMMGRSRYKMKNALIQTEAVTAAAYDQIRQQIQEEMANLSK